MDGVSVAGLVRDRSRKVIGLNGFGNLNLYRARLVLQAVSDVTPHEVEHAATSAATTGDSRRAGSPVTADQLHRAADAFGAQGEDDGVTAGFGVVNEVPSDEGTIGKSDSRGGILFIATFDMPGLGQKLLPKAMAHAGTHITDVRDGSLAKGWRRPSLTRGRRHSASRVAILTKIRPR